ncbi:hypothetical protein OTU49_016070 [Cherax quadricarinatus]|uniref:Myosin-M heavy chain n=1 Tax=Cherax quadricarinatus TaxID=27406 RepID=A0AAW0Y6C5_CHEQU
MESIRAYYEHPAAHANVPPREYCGSVTPAKARRSWGDLLKFRSRTKERHLSAVPGALTPPTAMPAAPPTHNYMAEYRQKYGAYNGTVGRASYQAMTVVKSISPTSVPPSSNLQKGYPGHGYPANGYPANGYPANGYPANGYPANGYAKHATSAGTISAGTRSTMSSTVRYTDWFGSVVGRRAPVRPPLPSFTAAPPVALHTAEKSTAWDHYVTLDPVYDAPRVVPVQLYTNVCVCPDQMINTKGRKKKKCKRCGRKVASMRHATAGVAAKVRPAIPASMYQVPPQPAPSAAQQAWGWQVLEERVYERYEVRSRPSAHSPVRPVSDDEESPPPTPETVRSVRSMKSVKSSDSSATITRDTQEPLRPAPQPPSVPRTFPSTPNVPTPATSSRSAKENNLVTETGEKRSSILTDSPTAYHLISQSRQTETHTGSDTDELSDNAVDVSYDGWDAQSPPSTTDVIQEGQVNVITIGDFQPQSVAVIQTPKVENGIDMTNKVRIHTNSTNSNKNVYSLNDHSHKYKKFSNYRNDSPPRNTYSSSSSDNALSTSPSSKSATSATRSSNKTGSFDNKSSSVSSKSSILNGKHTSANDKIISSSNKNSTSKNIKSNFKNSLSVGKNSSMNENMFSGGKNNSASNKTSATSVQKSMMNGHINSPMKVVKGSSSNGPRLEVKKLHETSELQHGGNTVRIAGQRMLVLTPGGTHQQHTGFSSGEDENEVSFEDDTSDYPMSSPTTTRGSDTDTLLEEDDIPLDSSESTYYPPSSQNELPSPNLGSSDSLHDSDNTQCERWMPARDTIVEEEENEDEWLKGNNQNDEIQEDDDESALLGDEDEKDDPSLSSSSTSSPLRQEGLRPTLSELLKVKSILKKPPSVDTSSETDSDFYLPTFSEFKQNQRKKKQVQFRSSHDVTVIEDAGESKGRKVPSARSLRRDREKAKEKQKNEYNLLADLHDVYSRNNSEMFSSNMNDDFSDGKFNHEQDTNIDINKMTVAVDDTHSSQEELGNEGSHEQDEEKSLFSNSEHNVKVELGKENGWSWNQKNEYTERDDEYKGSSVHRSLNDHQTSGVSTTDALDTINIGLNSNSELPAVNFDNFIPPLNTPTRQAPPPPRSRTLSPTRPSVPPPPPPTLRPSSLCIAPPQRPLPSPPALPLCPPPDSPPPSPTPPPLPTSFPPELEETQHIAMNHISEDLPSPQSPSFSSFKSNSVSLRKAKKINPSLALPAPSSEISRSTECLREVLPPLGRFSVFGADEETRTATIRGRGAAHARPSIVNAFTNGASADTSSTSSPPVAPRRRNRNRSLSPEVNESIAESGTRRLGGRVRRTSFLNRLSREENPYEQITDHIYEELLSRSPSRTSTFTGHSSSPTRSSTPHKSPSPGKSMFEGASKYEILEYLQDARRRVANTVDDDDDDTLQDLEDGPLDVDVDLEDEEEEEDQLGVDPSEDHFTVLTSRNRGNRSSNMSSNSDSSENSGLLRSDKERLTAGEVERTDSGVGSETSKPSVAVRRGQRGSAGAAMVFRDGDVPLCDDCDSPVDTHITNSGVVYAPLVCRRCSRRRQERKEILTEIMETEIKYGRDLRVMVDEFYRPILVAGLLTHDQLKGIFLNVEELVEHNRSFSLQLRDALEIALDQGDEDLLTVNVAKLFLHAAPMLHAFENYCVRQGSASILLQTLEKEKELLRIFLKVSQMENTLLRRMNLHSFLMVPVQRVTKYPLLLARLYKATPPTHPSREECRRAKEKIELHLQHMNNETKDMSPTKLWRRISMSVGSGAPLKRPSQPHDFSTNLKLRKLALEVLEWSAEEARVVREGRLFCLAPDSNNWTRRGRSLKMASVHLLLITLGSPTFVFEDAVPEDGLVTPRNLNIKDAAILAFKDHKVSKAALIRHEPWLLSRCVVAWECEGETECFELTDLNSRDTYIFKGSDSTSTEAWFRYIQFHALSVGMWKRRRPALANIMINGMNRS